MNRTLVARLLRLLLVACFVAVAFPLVITVLGTVMPQNEAAVLLPFVAAAASVAALPLVLSVVDRLVQRLARDSTTTPYSALAEAAARIRGGSLEQALPGLARVLAEGTDAQRAELWLAVEDRLVSAASYPPFTGSSARTVPSLAVLLAQPDTDHVVPVLDGTVLRAVLAIGKPDRPVTPSDQRLMQDVANGASMLLRGVQLNAELEERVRRADELAAELQASRQRLTQARDVERRRLIGELGNATTDRLTTLRADLADAEQALTEPEPEPESEPERESESEPAADGAEGSGPGPTAGGDTDGEGDEGRDDDGDEDEDRDGEPVELTRAEAAQQAIARARVRLDELLDRFRVIARGVYPAVLRDQGPYGALDELATDLPRVVRLTGTLPDRLAWEVESGIYYLAASAMQQLAGQEADLPLRVQLAHADGRLSVEIEDPTPGTSIGALRDGLAHDAERLAALGGDLEVVSDETGGARLRAWLPEELEPYVDRFSSVDQLRVGSRTGPS
jgi:signal transduction histidine kinase